MERLCLDNRLATVARWVLPGKPVADIGTDHAYLPCWLVLEGYCPSAIASDIAQGPYDQARRVVSDYGLTDRISLRRGSGLSVLERGEAATVVLAGMGGQLICELLAAEAGKAASAERIVLQPQRKLDLVRGWLADNGWRIIADDLALEGKMWYNIIVSEHGTMTLDEAELLYGRYTPPVSSDLRNEWLCFRRACLLEIAENLQEQTGVTASERKTEIEKEISLLERLIDEVVKC